MKTKKEIEDKIKILIDEGRSVMKGTTAMDISKLNEAEKIKNEVLALKSKLKVIDGEVRK